MSAGGKPGVTRRWQGNDADPLPTRLVCQRDRGTLSPTGQVRSRSVRAESFSHTVWYRQAASGRACLSGPGTELCRAPAPPPVGAPRSVDPNAASSAVLAASRIGKPMQCRQIRSARWTGSPSWTTSVLEANQSSLPGHKLRCNAASPRPGSSGDALNGKVLSNWRPLTRRCIASFWRHRMISTAMHARAPSVVVGPALGIPQRGPRRMTGPRAWQVPSPLHSRYSRVSDFVARTRQPWLRPWQRRHPASRAALTGLRTSDLFRRSAREIAPNAPRLAQRRRWRNRR
jgi:hypothetical protein